MLVLDIRQLLIDATTLTTTYQGSPSFLSPPDWPPINHSLTGQTLNPQYFAARNFPGLETLCWSLPVLPGLGVIYSETNYTIE